MATMTRKEVILAMLEGKQVTSYEFRRLKYLI